MSIANSIKSVLPEIERAKEFMIFIEKHFQTADKSLAVILLIMLTIMKFDGSRTIHEHVIEIINITERLKLLGMNMDGNFIVQFIINLLPPEYDPLQINYNIMKDK
jgi:hypothetical protein